MANKAGPKKAAYDKAYNARPEQLKRRAARNTSRAKMKAAGKVKKGQDVHHKDGNPKNQKASNMTSMSPKKNRGMK